MPVFWHFKQFLFFSIDPTERGRGDLLPTGVGRLQRNNNQVRSYMLNWIKAFTSDFCAGSEEALAKMSGATVVLRSPHSNWVWEKGIWKETENLTQNDAWWKKTEDLMQHESDAWWQYEWKIKMWTLQSMEVGQTECEINLSIAVTCSMFLLQGNIFWWFRNVFSDTQPFKIQTKGRYSQYLQQTIAFYCMFLCIQSTRSGATAFLLAWIVEHSLPFNLIPISLAWRFYVKDLQSPEIKWSLYVRILNLKLDSAEIYQCLQPRTQTSYDHAYLKGGKYMKLSSPEYVYF